MMIWFSLVGLIVGCESDSTNEKEKPYIKQREIPATPTTIKMVVNNGKITFPEGMDANNNPYLTYIEDNTDIDIEMIVPPSRGYQEMIDVYMTSSQVPDLINTSDASWVANNVEQEKLMRLDDLLRNYGQDLLKSFPDEVWDEVRYNGSIYAIPSLAEVAGNEVMYARKDWLDAVGLSPPKTLDEYYDVMWAFTYKDPDGNGKLDTWGLTIMQEGLSHAAPFFGAFGVPRSTDQINQWKEEDGELVYSGILDETEQALQFLAKLYGDGLLDRTFILNKQDSFQEKIIHGQVGLFSASWNDTLGPILENRKLDPDAEWIRLDYPQGDHGQTGTVGLPVIQSYTVIPAESKNATAVMKVLNFIAGKGYADLKFGFEGEVWTIENGEMVTNFEADFLHAYRTLYQNLADHNNTTMRKQRLDSFGEEYELNANVEMIHQHVLRSDYQGPPTPSMGKYGSKLVKLEDETFAKIIMGLGGSNEFSEFKKQWIHEGGWEITNEVNEWYREYRERELVE